MTRVVRPEAPDTLTCQGPIALQKHCELFDASPESFRDGTATFDFVSEIYASQTVKELLRTAQHKKCAFCESYFAHISFGDVEHFRPKAGYKQAKSDKLKRPGYYWLAYVWDNLFCSCQLCNERFKGNLFPLKDARRRAYSRNHNLANEQPLLVDPSVHDPENFITFAKEIAIPFEGCDEGTATIEVLGLNRDDLVEARMRHLKSLQELLDCREVLRKHAPKNRQQIERVEETIQTKTQPHAEYAAMVRAFLSS